MLGVIGIEALWLHKRVIYKLSAIGSVRCTGKAVQINSRLSPFTLREVLEDNKRILTNVNPFLMCPQNTGACILTFTGTYGMPSIAS
jgi:hypothetical protein